MNYPMNPILEILKHEINEWIAIMITSGNYEKNFYEGVLREVDEKYIILEISYRKYMSFEFNHFILATPLNRYH